MSSTVQKDIVDSQQQNPFTQQYFVALQDRMNSTDESELQEVIPPKNYHPLQPQLLRKKNI